MEGTILLVLLYYSDKMRYYRRRTVFSIDPWWVRWWTIILKGRNCGGSDVRFSVYYSVCRVSDWEAPVFLHTTHTHIKAYTDRPLSVHSTVGFWYRVYVEFTYIRSLGDANSEHTKIDYLWSYFCDINTYKRTCLGARWKLKLFVWNYFILNGDVPGLTSAGFGTGFPHTDDYFNNEGWRPQQEKHWKHDVPVSGMYVLPWTYIILNIQQHILILIPHWLTHWTACEYKYCKHAPTHTPTSYEYKISIY